MGTDTLSDSSSEDNFSVGKRIFSKLDCYGSCHIIFLLIVCVSCSLFASPQMIIIAFILFSLSFTASFWYLQKRTGNNISGCRWASPMWYIEVALLLYKDIISFLQLSGSTLFLVFVALHLLFRFFCAMMSIFWELFYF